MKSIKIGNKTIGQGHPLYFIADIGANHDGDINRAFRLIELAKEAGADAAKFQNFKADSIVSKHGFEQLQGKLGHQAKWNKSVYEIYQDASISQDWTPLLKQKCDEVGITYFTSPYDIASVDHVDPFVDVYKIGSGDITWTGIIDYISRKRKPVLIATGASTMQDVVRAMNVVESNTDDVVLMQCNTNYTTDKDKYRYCNLNVLKTLRQRFPDTILGLSDHTMTPATVLGAVALGALVFEKHFTDDNLREGPDHKFAINPENWRIMVDLANEVYESLGDGVKRIEENEQQAIVVQQRSLRAVNSLAAGVVLEEKHLEALRPIPENGLAPYRLNELLGKELVRPLEKGEHITLNHIKN